MLISQKSTDDEDYLPMTTFQVYPQATPPRPPASLLDQSDSQESTDVSEYVNASQPGDQSVVGFFILVT
jgi:hypothetical protein